MRRAHGTAARATAYKALFLPIGSANIAYLAGRIGDARPHRHRVRDGAPARGVVLLGATAALDFLTELLVGAVFSAPVLALTERIAVPRLAPLTVLGVPGV